MDVGSGTGFVPQLVAPCLKACDLFVCSDVSSTMLQVCKDNLANEGLECGLEFLLGDG